MSNLWRLVCNELINDFLVSLRFHNGLTVSIQVVACPISFRKVIANVVPNLFYKNMFHHVMSILNLGLAHRQIDGILNCSISGRLARLKFRVGDISPLIAIPILHPVNR